MLEKSRQAPAHARTARGGPCVRSVPPMRPLPPQTPSSIVPRMSTAAPPRYSIASPARPLLASSPVECARIMPRAPAAALDAPACHITSTSPAASKYQHQTCTRPTTVRFTQASNPAATTRPARYLVSIRPESESFPHPDESVLKLIRPRAQPTCDARPRWRCARRVRGALTVVDRKRVRTRTIDSIVLPYLRDTRTV